MKAIIVKKSGGPEVLALADIDKPRPGRGELLIRVKAATVTVGDAKLRSMSRAILVPVGLIFGFKPMKVAGVEFAGVVEELGDGATDYAVGERVLGTTTGLARGANAEFVVVPVKSRMGVLARLPESLPFEEGAALPVGSMTAWQILQKAGPLKGRRVLVYGASGSVGSYAVQLAALHGASVSAFCGAANSAMVRGLGAAAVFDYRSQALAEAGEQDIVFDAVGKLSRRDYAPILAQGGAYLSVRGPTSERADELRYLVGLAAEGRIKPFIDRRIRLEEVPGAHRLVDSGRKRGNIVVAMD
jgi:NADPH:quinone reductase-like Zn-dependent oxidoreductase